MKTYLSAGIGDMVSLDCMLTLEEKASISEIYWACRFGQCMIPLIDNNPDYPNVRVHYILDDEVGKQAMALLDPIAVDFWHFRCDVRRNFQIGLKLFQLEEEYNKNNVQTFDVAGILWYSKPLRPHLGSSFIKYVNPTPYGEHILFHYTTSTRPRGDIAAISSEDWKFVDELSRQTGLKVVVIADHAIPVPLSNYELLVNPNMRFIADLAASCTYYAGCDSFCAHLAVNQLPKERIFIKSHEPHIHAKLMGTEYCRCFLPHSPADIASFYKPYIGWPK